MALHPQVVDLIRRAEEAGVRPAYELSPREARVQMEQMSKTRDRDRTEVGTVTDRRIEGAAGDLPLRMISLPAIFAQAGAAW